MATKKQQKFGAPNEGEESTSNLRDLSDMTGKPINPVSDSLERGFNPNPRMGKGKDEVSNKTGKKKR